MFRSNGFRLLTGHRLNVNDESLELGGVFDLSQNWSRPHCSHRDGRSADLRTNATPGQGLASIPRRDSIIVVTHAEQIFGSRMILSEGDPPHLHVKVP